MKTPRRSAPVTTVEPTPGQLVSQRQADILTRERFSEVLGDDVVQSWGVHWSVFTDPTLEFDSHFRRNQLKIIISKMDKCRINTPAYLEIFAITSQIKNDMETVHAKRLDQIGINYFTALYPHSQIESLDKQGGVQLGERIQVTLSDGNSLLYHVKTHSQGRLSEKSTAPKLVNPQELLAYKILESLSFGCEVHFFEKSPEDVYIATLDVNFVTRNQKGKFNVFHKASGDLGRGNNVEYGQSIWGTLHTAIQSIHQNGGNTDWRLVEEKIATDERAANFMNQQATLDILTRIMRLCDLLNNPENFGFVSCDDTPPKLKVIDFRVMDPKELVLEDSDFRGFLVGNGIYDYASSHKTMSYTLKYRSREKRVSHALNIMNTHLNNIQTLIQQAHQFVLGYLDKPVFAPVAKELKEKLDIYAQAICENAQFFKAELEDWSPEKDANREAARQYMISKAS